MRPGSRGPHRSAGSRLRTLRLDGPAGPIEGILQERDARDHAWFAIVCHPHPQHGGTLHNKVVHKVAAELHELGGAVLRFNFRGVGHSAGSFDHGVGELEDARAALGWMEDRYPAARQWLAGFSFGSWVAARLAGAAPAIERVILVAPPVGTADFSVLRTTDVPKLIIQGTADDICPLAALSREFLDWAPPKTLIRVPGASHFFHRQLTDLAEALRQGLAEIAAISRRP